jgi:hypothetical protein
MSHDILDDVRSFLRYGEGLDGPAERQEGTLLAIGHALLAIAEELKRLNEYVEVVTGLEEVSNERQ